jgi:hypothetical protein
VGLSFAWGVDVYVRIFVFFCVGRDLAVGQSNVQQNVLRHFLLLELVLDEEGKKSMYRILEH